MKKSVLCFTVLNCVRTSIWSTLADLRLNVGIQHVTWILEYHITGCAELLVTRRKKFAECCTARQIVAPSCIRQIDGDKPEPIYKNFAWAVIPLQMLTPYATQEPVTKWRDSCHQLLFLTRERTSDVSSRCCFFCRSAVSLVPELWNQPVSHNAAHSRFSFIPFPPPSLKMTACRPPCFITTFQVS